MSVIDVHTHMLSRDFLALLQEQGGHYKIAKTKAGQETIYNEGAPFMTLFPAMWDYDQRIKDMDAAGVDVAIVSLTSPNCYFGGRETSLKAARMVNDSMAAQQRARPGRIRWFASLPWQYADDAKAELARTVKAGAVGVMVLANIDGAHLTIQPSPRYGKRSTSSGCRAVHPTTPPGFKDMQLDEYGLVPPIGFMIDTTLAIARMILAGFIDDYPKLKLIAAHGGATLPYLVGRLDQCYDHIPAARERIKAKPSEYLQRIWYDTVVYDPRALEMCIAVAGSPDRVLYGSTTGKTRPWPGARRACATRPKTGPTSLRAKTEWRSCSGLNISACT
jgi:aminocarboxymuconate-semialdehyde decarboxylase